MPTTLPSTIEEIKATSQINPEFAQAWDDLPLPPGKDYTLEALKAGSRATLPNLRKKLAASQPPDLIEKIHRFPLRDGVQLRVIVLYRSQDASPTTPPRPLIVMFHGGGHTVGSPEAMVPLARDILKAQAAVIVLASYRLAPEFPFPFSLLDSWETLEWAATESRKFKSTVLPICTDPRVGFLIGGESAGANLTAALSHIARDQALSPPITGQFLHCGTFISPERVPPNYQDRYLSWTQNEDAPVIDKDLYAIFRKAFNPDHDSRLWASFDQHHPADQGTGGVKNGHLIVPPTYFQVCGLDMARDDGLIYERVLREECQVPTRLDLYPGFPHCWWSIYPQLDMTKKRTKDAVDGIAWLLEVGMKTRTYPNGARR